MTRALLKLFDGALADHVRNIEAGELRVVTAIVGDATREPNRSLIKAVCDHAGGRFIEAAQQWLGVPDRGDTPLEHMLSAALRDPVEVEFIREGDTVRARHPGGPDPENNAAAATFLGLINSLLDRRLLETELAVLLYEEGELDVDRAQAAWEIVTGQLRGVPLGRLRTLVVIVATAQINYRRHCARDRGVRFAVQGDQLLERRRWTNTRADIERLANTTEPVVLFLAAGASASSGLPVGDTMRDEAIRRLLPGAPEDELAERFFAYSQEIDQLLPGEELLSVAAFSRTLTLERVLYLEQQDAPDHNYGPTMLDFVERHATALNRRGPAVRAVQRMLSVQHRLVIVTVNVDELVEDGREAEVEIFASEDDFTRCPAYLTDYVNNGGRIPLLKLHGTVSRPETVVVSVDRVARGLTDDQMASLNLLRGSANAPRTWIYVGSSMRDRDVTQLLGLPSFASELEEWWVTPFSIPTVDQFINEHRRQRWHDAGRREEAIERTITETADVFLEEYERLWTPQNQ